MGLLGEEVVVFLGGLVQLTLVLVGRRPSLDGVLAQVAHGHHRLVQHQRLPLNQLLLLLLLHPHRPLLRLVAQHLKVPFGFSLLPQLLVPLELLLLLEPVEEPAGAEETLGRQLPVDYAWRSLLGGLVSARGDGHDQPPWLQACPRLGIQAGRTAHFLAPRRSEAVALLAHAYVVGARTVAVL